MEIGNGFVEECNAVGGPYCGGPPRQCHQQNENPIFTVGRKPVQDSIPDSIPREWPFLYIAPLWLNCRPPFHPSCPIVVGVGDDRHSIEGSLPGFHPGLQLLWSRCCRKALKLLDVELLVAY